jgi:hypothetical protein
VITPVQKSDLTWGQKLLLVGCAEAGEMPAKGLALLLSKFIGTEMGALVRRGQREVYTRVGERTKTLGRAMEAEKLEVVGYGFNVTPWYKVGH